MNKSRLSSLLLGLGAATLPASVWAQASGESAAMGPSAGAQVVGGEPTPARSALWQTIDATHRQRDGAATPDRRLSAEERQQMREQIRRAAPRLNTEQALRTTHLEPR